MLEVPVKRWKEKRVAETEMWWIGTLTSPAGRLVFLKIEGVGWLGVSEFEKITFVGGGCFDL